jgi:hypothetical protein
MTPEELDIIERRLAQRTVKISDLRKLIDALRSALKSSLPDEAEKAEEGEGLITKVEEDEEPYDEYNETL